MNPFFGLATVGAAVALGRLVYGEDPLPRNLCDSPVRSSSHFLDRIHSKLGMDDRRLPKDFKGKFKIDGHTVVVFPSRASKDKHGRRFFPKKRVSGRDFSLTRVFFLVGKGKLIPAGRIQQSKFCGGTGGRG